LHTIICCNSLCMAAYSTFEICRRFTRTIKLANCVNCLTFKGQQKYVITKSVLLTQDNNTVLFNFFFGGGVGREGWWKRAVPSKISWFARVLCYSQWTVVCALFLNSVSPALTSPMTSPVRHLNHQQLEMLMQGSRPSYANEEEESRSLSTPPLPMKVASETQQFIKAEPMSPGRQGHLTSAGQGQTQSQDQTTAVTEMARHGRLQTHTDCRDSHVKALCDQRKLENK